MAQVKEIMHPEEITRRLVPIFDSVKEAILRSAILM